MYMTGRGQGTDRVYINIYGRAEALPVLRPSNDDKVRRKRKKLILKKFSLARGAYFSLRQRKVSKEGRLSQGEFSCKA